MNGVVTVLLKKQYMNFPIGAKVRLPREKAELLVERGTAVIEGGKEKKETFTQQEVDIAMKSKQKKVVKLLEENEKLKAENRRLKKYIDSPQEDKMMRNSKVIKKAVIT